MLGGLADGVVVVARLRVVLLVEVGGASGVALSEVLRVVPPSHVVPEQRRSLLLAHPPLLRIRELLVLVRVLLAGPVLTDSFLERRLSFHVGRTARLGDVLRLVHARHCVSVRPRPSEQRAFLPLLVLPTHSLRLQSRARGGVVAAVVRVPVASLHGGRPLAATVGRRLLLVVRVVLLRLGHNAVVVEGLQVGQARLHGCEFRRALLPLVPALVL